MSWLAALAFGFTVLGATLAQEAPSQQQDAEDHAEDAPAETDQPPLPIATEESVAETDAAEQPIDPAEQREIDDLAAQSTMANAAIAEVILAALGLIAAGGAAVFAGMAWKQARRQADIAERALNETQRAFMSVFQANYTSTMVDQKVDGVDGNWIGLSFSARNVGHTAARNVRLTIAHTKVPIENELEISDFDMVINERGTVLGSGMNINSAYRFFKKEDFLAAYHGRIALYLLARVDYDDVISKEPRHTQVSYRIEFGGDPQDWWDAPRQPLLNIVLDDQLTSYS